MAYQSPYPSVAIPDQKATQHVLESAASRGDKPAFIDGASGETVTYRELLDVVRDTAARLGAEGFRAGDVCAIHCQRVSEFAEAFFAVLSLGGVVTPINSLFTRGEFKYQLQDSGATFLITSAESLTASVEASATTAVAHVFAFDRADGVPRPLKARRSRARPTSEWSRENLAVLPYFIGTSGVAKGVMLTHHNIVASLAQFEAAEHVDGDEILVSALPLDDFFGMHVVVNGGLRAGATIVALQTFEPETLLNAVQQHRITTAYVAPPMVRALARAAPIHCDVSSLAHVLCVPSPIDASLARSCSERLGVHVRQAYGLAETTSLTHLVPRGSSSDEGVGFVLPSTEFRIVDVESGVDDGPGAFGEIWIRGPQVMLGYLGDPETTLKTIDRDGWLHTGDVGYADMDGRLSVVDRRRALGKFRGYYSEHERLLSAVDEIRARKVAKERLDFQALILDSVRDSVIAVDSRSRVLFWNRGAEALFGYQAAEALGRRVTDLVFPKSEGPETFERIWSELFEQGSWKAQRRRRRKDGSLFYSDISLAPVWDAQGKPSAIISVHRNITELRSKEQMLQDSREQLRNLAASLMAVREQERAAIARELHDELGQLLTRLNIDLLWLTDRLPAKLQTERTKGMVLFVERMLDTIRNLCARLRPAILDDLGLEAAIEWQARQLSKGAGLQSVLELHLRGMKPDHDRDTAIFRIVQEALTNVARHSRARHVTVRARVLDDQFSVEVEDDGVGVPEGQLRSSSALGLIGMRERAEGLGGTLAVLPRHPHGTRVKLTIPLASRAQAS